MASPDTQVTDQNESIRRSYKEKKRRYHYMARVTEPPRWLYGNVRAEETLNWLRNSCISCLTFSWRYAAQGITKRVTSCIASNSESCRLTGLNEPLVGMIGQNNW